MNTFRQRLCVLMLGLALAGTASAQVAIPNTLVAGTTIHAADLNTNFSTLGNHALDRLSGGNIAGNVTLDVGITIDGIDLSTALCSSCAATFASLTVNGVLIVNTSGLIPAISSTYFASLSGANLTGLNATQLTSGTVPLARLTGITNTEIAAAAGIAYSKLTLTGAILDADVNAAAAVAWSKLSKAGSSLADLATRSAGDLSSGTVATARLGSGSATSATFLRGDSTWAGAGPAWSIVGKTANYSPALGELVEITSGSSITITLPAASGCTATSYAIGLKNNVAATVAIARTGGDTIDGATSFTTSGVQYESYDFVCNAAHNGWMIR